jgi:hypothetical protein
VKRSGSDLSEGRFASLTLQALTCNEVNMREISKFSESTIATGGGGASLLDIDSALFAANFNQRPFLIGHRLCDHPLFALSSLMDLAKRLPEKDIEYNSGNLPMSVDPKQTPRNGLSIEETIRRIEECKSWMVMKYVENDPVYRDMLHECLAEVKPHSEKIVPGMTLAQGFIFITSPNSVTPYHMDPEHNFLLQVRGSKTVREFDRCVVSAEEMERFYDGAHRNLVYKDEYLAKSWTFDLQPGFGLHFPHTFPHWVQNGPAVSISFSITFRTPDLERISMIHNANGWLRRRGITPASIGASPWRDEIKHQAARVVRRVRRIFGA